MKRLIAPLATALTVSGLGILAWTVGPLNTASAHPQPVPSNLAGTCVADHAGTWGPCTSADTQRYHVVLDVYADGKIATVRVTCGPVFRKVILPGTEPRILCLTALATPVRT